MPALGQCSGRKVCICYMWAGQGVPAAHTRPVRLHSHDLLLFGSLSEFLFKIEVFIFALLGRPVNVLPAGKCCVFTV